MSKARDLANLLGGSGGVAEFQGESGIVLPDGTTAQRPATPVVGTLRYNTTLGKNEAYDSKGWTSIDVPPSITGISPTSDLVGDTTITVNGTNFQAGATVSFVGNDGTEIASPTVTYVSSTQLTAKTPATPMLADLDPYKVKVTNPTGLSNVSEGLLDTGSSPAWSTTSSLGTIAAGSAFSRTLLATDPDGQSVSYSSITLPTGTSLSSSGVLTGTADAVTSTTTRSFEVTASDGVNNTPKTFNIIYARPSALINGTGTYLDSAYSQQGAGYYTFTPEQDMVLFIDMWGAGGGGGSGGHGHSYGSAGGEAFGEIAVTAGTPYVFLIGQGGHGGNKTIVRSFPDGGYGDNGGYGAAGGGGSTRFGLEAQSGFDFTNTASSYNNTNAVYHMIAGGGAGGCDYIYGYSGTPAGYGGGLVGADGGAWYPSGESLESTGKGGTQSAGGAEGTTPARISQLSGATGAKYYGGNGSGSGGGGGYYGGGGARGYYSMAGGGSGYLGSSVVNGGFATATAGSSTHYISNNANSYKTGSVGNGGSPGGGGGNNGGIIIINAASR